MYTSLTSLSRVAKGVIMIYLDLVIIAVSFFSALALRLNDPWPMAAFLNAKYLLAILLVGGVLLTQPLRLHLTKMSAYDTSAALKSATWVVLVTLVGVFSNVAFSLGAPRTVPLIFGAVLFVLIFSSRYLVIFLLSWLADRERGLNRIPIAVYGCGAGGLQLIAALKSSRLYRPVMFVDDNSHMQGLTISGLQVYTPSSLGEHLKSGRIQKVFLAIPSISPSKKRQMIQELKDLDCEVLELPSYVEMIQSGGILNSLRPVSPEDLLGRDGVDLNIPEVEKTYKGANVMVSGAGGSIGSELCRMVLEIGPKKLVLFEMSEFALYSIEQELQQLALKQGVELVPVLGSVNDARRLKRVFKEHRIEAILHAAAYKHVPLVESNELEGIRNNVLGTKTLAETALLCGVKRFTLVSTDKAVRPANVMGASKRLGELVIQQLAQSNPDTVFSIVRFGNVLGSSGSVIPLFKKQLENGGPITLTHEEITRYFMTIPEAARLVLLAGSYAEGGEVFVLDMGEPVKILDLAKRMIELSGNTVRDETNPNGDIEIKITGLRPGEKLYEELLIGADTLPTPHPKIMRARESKLTAAELKKAMAMMEKAIANDDRKLVRDMLKTWVEGYQPADCDKH